jgi:uncharacterized protein (TIGR02231 family)
MDPHTPILLDAPVAEVTLFEDRAQVLRRGQLQLDAGAHRIRLAELSPVVVDRSLRAVLDRSDGGPASLIDLRVRRERVAEEVRLPERLRELQREERQRAQALTTLHKRKGMLEEERDQLLTIRRQLLSEAGEDCGWGRLQPEVLRESLRSVSERVAHLDGERLTLLDGLEDAERELSLLRARIEGERDPRSVLRAWIELDVVLERPGALQIELAYLVPGACWRPRYRATLQGGSQPTLSLELEASVWQHTGEDWREAQLCFSTQRPSLGSAPPELGEDLLRTRPRQEQIEVEVREQNVQTTGLGQRRAAAQELPGVDDGGEPVSLRAAQRTSVPSHGRPCRVPIGRSQAPATVEHVVMAEQVSAALRRCTSVNRADHPLLAGPVDLVADSGRVGRTELGFLAPGERLELGFGPDPDLRVFRRVEQVEQDKGALSRWQRTDHSVEIRISNMGSEPRRLLVVERVPVSEIEQVRVELDPERTTGGVSPDRDGLVRWERELAAGATDRVTLVYGISKRSAVVER